VGLHGVVPFSLEGELKRLGGIYESSTAWAPFAIADGRLVTGQNPSSSKATAEKLAEVLGSP
jgi:putative intracellular protease/amidase